MPSVEERIAIVETKQDQGIELLKEIRNDVKKVYLVNTDQDLRLVSLEQSRTTARKFAKVLGVPVLGTVLHTVFKAVGLY